MKSRIALTVLALSILFLISCQITPEQIYKADMISESVQGTANIVAPFLPPPWNFILIGLGTTIGGAVAAMKAYQGKIESYNKGVKVGKSQDTDVRI